MKYLIIINIIGTGILLFYLINCINVMCDLEEISYGKRRIRKGDKNVEKRNKGMGNKI